MDYTTDELNPNVPLDGTADFQRCYIEHTKGLRIRKNRAEDTLELWIDGVLHAEWRHADRTDRYLTTLVRYAYDAGALAGKATNQKQLRDALGL